jgi:phospholipase D-like protein
MPFEGGFTFANFLADVFTVFVFVVWFWLLIIVFGDLFRRHDISGRGKALWVIGLILFPYIGVLAYMITQAGGMAVSRHERSCGASLASAPRTRSASLTSSRNQDRSPTRNIRVFELGWFNRTLIALRPRE